MKPALAAALAAAGVVGAAALVVSWVGGTPAPQDDYTPATVSGRVVFQEACVKCHGIDGKGTALAPLLKGRSLPPERIRSQVESGSGRMPKFPNITGEALRDLAAFVHRL